MRGSVNFEQNYVTSLPEGTKIKKRYFENSQYAQILVLDNGEFYVQKMTTLVYFKAGSYASAAGLRKMISERCGGIDRELTSGRY